MNDVTKPKKPSTVNPATAELIEKGHTITTKPNAKSEYAQDKRELARNEHTNHFTNRSPNE